MKVVVLLAVLLTVSGCDQALANDEFLSPLTAVFEAIYDKLLTTRRQVAALARQTMLQQFFIEEKIRSDGDSGIRLTRGGAPMLKNYQTNTHIGRSVFNVHDHPDYDRTIGMGEVVAVLNGVEFRTRHNDYKLIMPSTTSFEYHATEPIPFPDVPPEVTQLDTVKEQVAEMQEWFRAFSQQDPSVRDYTKYFKPVLCYMEGAWTRDEDNDFDEPFKSDRHRIDADSWLDLQEKIRYLAYSGNKHPQEDVAFLPTTIISVDRETGIPIYAQWNYRIMCFPLERDIPTDSFKLADDLAYRQAHGKTMDSMAESRAARFILFEGERGRYELLDELFNKVPGWDNYLAHNVSDDGVYEEKYELGSDDLVPLSPGFYHRGYKMATRDAMGLSRISLGFNDANLWVAETTQRRVASIGLKQCEKRLVGERRKLVCEKEYNKFTYAIPLEIIYLTPLLSWNPYNFTIHQEAGIATAGSRSGRGTLDAAYDGIDKFHYYLTPIEFFKSDSGMDKDQAFDDIATRVAHVLDQQGVMRKVTASGTVVKLRDIGGSHGAEVGNVRLRYPIGPVHGEGSSVWKELNALKDLVQENVVQEVKPGLIEF